MHPDSANPDAQIKSTLVDVPATTVLTVLLICGFIVELVTILSFGERTFRFLFAVEGIANPRPAWVLALFAHSGPVHLSLNALSLGIYGWAVESTRSSRVVIAVFFLAGIPGPIIHTTIVGGTGAGASGATIGLIAFYAADSFRHYIDNTGALDRPFHSLAVIAVGIVFLQLGIDILLLNGINYAHLTGAVIGASLGFAHTILSRVLDRASGLTV